MCADGWTGHKFVATIETDGQWRLYHGLLCPPPVGSTVDGDLMGGEGRKKYGLRHPILPQYLTHERFLHNRRRDRQLYTDIKHPYVSLILPGWLLHPLLKKGLRCRIIQSGTKAA